MIQDPLASPPAGSVDPAAGRARTVEQQRTSGIASAATVLVLGTFVTPLATQGRTALALSAGPSSSGWTSAACTCGPGARRGSLCTNPVVHP